MNEYGFFSSTDILETNFNFFLIVCYVPLDGKIFFENVCTVT